MKVLGWEWSILCTFLLYQNKQQINLLFKYKNIKGKLVKKMYKLTINITQAIRKGLIYLSTQKFEISIKQF